jgi:lipopolysaccharide/colanic/teichoic acid biosynthesis glycosyltransferase
MKTGAEYLVGNSKRNLDVIGSTAIIGLSLPVGVVAAGVIAVDTDSPNPFFVQSRLGSYESTFRAFKLRTIPKHAQSSDTFGTFDPRASSVGQFIRQSGIDELPQLYNVLLGSMSLVGCRPMIENDMDFMEFSAPKIFDEWYSYYQISRPGLTGLSQIYRHHYRESRTKEHYSKSAELDLRYFSNASLLGDLKILARTPVDALMANVNVVENNKPLTATELPEANPLT